MNSVHLSTETWLGIVGALILHSSTVLWIAHRIINAMDRRVTRLETIIEFLTVKPGGSLNHTLNDKKP